MISSKRESGVLLHITSLPNSYGIGDIGPSAYWFVDQLKEMGQSLWQILPTNPPDNYNCPYSASSAFANNPYLISPDLLVDDGLLIQGDLENCPEFDSNQVQFSHMIPWKKGLLKKAISHFRASSLFKTDFETYCHENNFWLNDFALFQVLSDLNNGADWAEWEIPYKSYYPQFLKDIVTYHKREIEDCKILQFLYYHQWKKLHAYAKENGVQLVGDIPIYISYNSADVWANKNLFKLNSKGEMTAQSGCPPDFFIEDGQVWGHPLYAWETHESTEYEWWVNRLRHLYKFVDIVRIDHFNGFVKYWEIPASDNTGKNGQWLPGPNQKIFEKIYQQLDSPRIMAEDLGEAAGEAIPLRETFNIPGMKILQMSFGNGDPFGEISPNTVVYTGTHDNDTAIGWYQQKGTHQSGDEFQQERHHANQCLKLNGQDIHWPFIEYTLKSMANTAIIPLQDILGLDSSARMNRPGTIGQNWEWRFSKSQLTEEIIQKMKQLTLQSNRK